MTRELNVSKEELKELYLDENLSSHEIARVFNCYHSTILSKLRKYKVDRRQPKKEIIISKEKLEELYLKRKLSTYEISKMFGCKSSTILSKLKKSRIKTRHIKKFKITKNQLESYYVKKKYSIFRISQIIGCSPTIIFRRLSKYKIPTRESSVGIYTKEDFSGDMQEMAYMLGFRYGDLSARLSTDRIIEIKCGTTKQEQVELIKNIFDKYGHIWVGKPDKRGAMQVQVTLNRTFDFLLSKKDKIPEWIVSNENFFWAFFCGYTDAEGNMGVYSRRARVRVGSYDKTILTTFYGILNDRFGIKTKFRLETPKGTNNQNQDFWRISVNDRYALLKLFQYIKPMIKHQKRFNDLLSAEENIIQRTGDKIN